MIFNERIKRITLMMSKKPEVEERNFMALLINATALMRVTNMKLAHGDSWTPWKDPKSWTERVE